VGTPPANLIPVRPVDGGIEFAGTVLPGGFTLEGPAQAMYRPETLGISSSEGPRTLALDFAEASPVAGRIMVTGTRGDLRLTAVVDKAPKLVPGDTVYFALPEAPAALFTSTGEVMA
jgi:iron(III) transport system ATP-binding protein